jgi:hypothetical protein
MMDSYIISISLLLRSFDLSLITKCLSLNSNYSFKQVKNEYLFKISYFIPNSLKAKIQLPVDSINSAIISGQAHFYSPNE